MEHLPCQGCAKNMSAQNCLFAYFAVAAVSYDWHVKITFSYLVKVLYALWVKRKSAGF